MDRIAPMPVLTHGEEAGPGRVNYWLFDYRSARRYTMKSLINLRSLLLIVALLALGGCGGGGGGSSTPASTLCVLGAAGTAGTIGCTLG